MASLIPSERTFSNAFEHYSHKLYLDGGTKMQGTCNYCEAQIRGKAGVSSNFLTHLRRKHPEKYEECVPNRSSRSSKIVASTTSIITNPVSTPLTQMSSATTPGPSSAATPTSISVQAFIPGTIQKQSKQLFNSKHAVISTQITKMIVTDLLPLQIVEGKGFKELLYLMDPSYTVVTQTQLKQGILPWYTKTVEEKIQNLISEMESYNLTVDVWNASTLTAYVGFSVSFLTPKWHTKTVLLACSCVTGYDRLQKIPALLKDALQEHNIFTEPHCMVLNDCSNSEGVNLLGSNEDAPIIKVEDRDQFPLVHVKSFSSLLSNSIREGLITGLAPYKTVLDAVAMIIAEIRKSSEATQKVFGEEISEDSKTNITWILHLLLIRCMLKYTSSMNTEDMMEELLLTGNGLFTEHQKSILAEIVSILELFEEAMDMVESKSLPVSICLPSLISLKNHLIAKSDGVCSKLALSLLSALNTNFSDFTSSSLYVCSAVLDPRFKLSWCTSNQAETFKAIVLREAQKIFDASSKSNNNTTDNNSTNNHCTSSDSNAIAKSKLFSFIASNNTIDSKSTVLTPVNELDSYLKDSQEVHDPFSYWRARSGIYPTLHQLAKYCLCLPASPTPMNKVFHQSSSTLNEDLCYSWLSLDNLETLLFLKASASEIELF